MTSLTTSDEADRPQPAPALRVAGGEPPATKAKGFSVHYTQRPVTGSRAETPAWMARTLAVMEPTFSSERMRTGV